MWVMTSVEAMFLVAEATARGWLSGNAQNAYNAAVRESFVTLAVPNATTEATTYLSNPNPRVAWPTSSALADKLNVIIWQKYFALNGLQANETWVDFRRLGIVAAAAFNIPAKRQQSYSNSLIISIFRVQLR